MSWTSEAEVSGKFQRKTEMYLPGEQKPDSEQTKIAGVCCTVLTVIVCTLLISLFAVDIVNHKNA